MRFSRQMIELIQQIRKPIMAELGEQILLADPLLMEKLARVAGRTNDAMVKLAIAEVIRLADDAPPVRPGVAAAPAGQGNNARKIYRGCVVS